MCRCRYLTEKNDSIGIPDSKKLISRFGRTVYGRKVLHRQCTINHTHCYFLRGVRALDPSDRLLRLIENGKWHTESSIAVFHQLECIVECYRSSTIIYWQQDKNVTACALRYVTWRNFDWSLCDSSCRSFRSFRVECRIFNYIAVIWRFYLFK